jgi:hypoxanthine-guanine phosphoribosyltransferase
MVCPVAESSGRPLHLPSAMIASMAAVPIRYVGFDIPPDFVAGYGMDYAQR